MPFFGRHMICLCSTASGVDLPYLYRPFPFPPTRHLPSCLNWWKYNDRCWHGSGRRNHIVLICMDNLEGMVCLSSCLWKYISSKYKLQCHRRVAETILRSVTARKNHMSAAILYQPTAANQRLMQPQGYIHGASMNSFPSMPPTFKQAQQQG